MSEDSHFCYDDDDDEESSTPLRDIIISELPPCIEITLVLSTNEPKDSLIMEDEHFNTIPEKESDEFIKSSVENLVPNLSESEDLSNIEQSLLNQDSLIISSSKIDSLLDEFTGELIFLKSIPPGIDEADYDPEEEIHLIEKLLYDNREINLFLTSDGSIPPRIDSDYSDSEGDNLFPERLLHDDPLPLPDILDYSNVV
nr:hypothetical protein [Tanacetum cinerariifolium]